MDENTDLKTVQEYWYGRLEQEGFQDIESSHLTDRPLKDWHSFKYISEVSMVRLKRRSEYQNKIENFLNNPELTEITYIMTKHGNSSLKPHDLKIIFTLHAKGETERAIGKHMDRSKTCIHLIIERLRAWMDLI